MPGKANRSSTTPNQVWSQKTSGLSRKIKECIKEIENVLSRPRENFDFTYQDANTLIKFLETVAMVDKEGVKLRKSDSTAGERIFGNAYADIKDIRNTIFHGSYILTPFAYLKIFPRLATAETLAQFFKDLKEFLDIALDHIQTESDNAEEENPLLTLQEFKQRIDLHGTNVFATLSTQKFLDLVLAMISHSHGDSQDVKIQPESLQKLIYDATVNITVLLHQYDESIDTLTLFPGIRDIRNQLVHSFHNVGLNQQQVKLLEFYRESRCELGRLALALYFEKYFRDFPTSGDFKEYMEERITEVSKLIRPSPYGQVFLLDQSLTEAIKDYFYLFAPVDNATCQGERGKAGFPKLTAEDRRKIHKEFNEYKRTFCQTTQGSLNETEKENTIIQLLQEMGISRSKFEEMKERYVQESISEDEESEIQEVAQKLCCLISTCINVYGMDPLEALAAKPKTHRIEEIKLKEYRKSRSCVIQNIDKIITEMVYGTDSLYHNLLKPLEDPVFILLLKHLLLRKTADPLCLKMLLDIDELAPVVIEIYEESDVQAFSDGQNFFKILTKGFPTSSTKKIYLGRLFELCKKLEVESNLIELYVNLVKEHLGVYQDMSDIFLHRNSEVDYFNKNLFKSLCEATVDTDTYYEFLLSTLSQTLRKAFQWGFKLCVPELLELMEWVLETPRFAELNPEVILEATNAFINISCKAAKGSLDKKRKSKLKCFLEKCIRLFDSIEPEMEVTTRLAYMYDIAYHISCVTRWHEGAGSVYELLAETIGHSMIVIKDFSRASMTENILSAPGWKQYSLDFNKPEYKFLDVVQIYRDVAYELVQQGKVEEEETKKAEVFGSAADLYRRLRKIESITETGKFSTKTLIPLADLLNSMTQSKTFTIAERVQYAMEGFDCLQEALNLAFRRFPERHPQFPLTLLRLVDRLLHLEQMIMSLEQTKQELKTTTQRMRDLAIFVLEKSSSCELYKANSKLEKRRLELENSTLLSS